VHRELNTSGKARQIILVDGTEILLEHNSEISFEEPFRNNRRDIVLKGKAVFKVAKDKDRPFSVISGDIKTTALGTSFMVSAFPDSENILIQLYEGKVVISDADFLLRKLNDNFYLLPGQEFIYRIKEAKSIVRLINRNNPAKKENKEVLPLENPSLPKRDKTSWYMFNNQPVGSVFHQLAEMYQTEIIFHENDVAKIYFIGKFDKSDSLENILREITTANNLKIIRKHNKFFITK
jgi:ferric-dicitrate binding protein FerR (iron transport regulator)